MKKLGMLVAFITMLGIAKAHGTSYLGTDNQPVSNADGTALSVISTVTVNVAPASGAKFDTTGSTVVVTGPNGGAIPISGTLTPSGTFTVVSESGAKWDVSGSSVGIRGSNGAVIQASTLAAGGSALDVINKGMPNLDGKSAVYKSSDAMVVGGSLTLTGLAKSIDLISYFKECTFSINGGDNILMLANTSESYDFAYTLVNPSVTLSAKTGSATCKVRIVGAN